MSTHKILVIAILLLTCGNCARRKPSNFVVHNETVVEALSKLELVPTVKTWPVSEEPPVSGEVFVLPIAQPTDVVADGPRYYIFKPDNADHFWIMVYFGFSQQVEWRGPVSLTGDNHLVRRWDSDHMQEHSASKYCEAHGVELQEDTVEIVYGLPDFSEGHLEALRSMFPNANTVYFGGCTVMPELPKTTVVLYCRPCRQAKKEWRESQQLGDR